VGQRIKKIVAREIGLTRAREKASTKTKSRCEKERRLPASKAKRGNKPVVHLERKRKKEYKGERAWRGRSGGRGEGYK